MKVSTKVMDYKRNPEFNCKKSKLFKKYIKCDDWNKNILPQEYETYSLSTLSKQSKKRYYNNHFKSNINNIKNTWKRIKTTISLNNEESESLKIIVATRVNSLLTQKTFWVSKEQQF